jgi:NAD(P)-dependent dehydrogenase (short-subunit alcohol dehydrogenase family)
MIENKVDKNLHYTFIGGSGEVKLKGKVALMMASGAGIGRATSILFSREGAKVVVNNRSAQGGLETVELIRKGGGQALFFQADVSDAARVKEMVDFTVGNFGRLDILFNNAAYTDTEAFLPLADIPVEVWDRAIAVGLRSYFLGCKYAIPAMLKNGGGVIINISSVGGMEGVQWYSHYNCVKAAIINLTRNLALDYSRQNIRSVCICPQGIATRLQQTSFPGEKNPYRTLRRNMSPIDRVGKPEEVANLALFLASDEAAYITGVSIPIDGGASAGKFIHNWAEIFPAAMKK